MRKGFFTCLFSVLFLPFFAQQLSSDEQRLYELIMEYRLEKNLPEIPLSPSLTIVAQAHVRDLAENEPNKGRCNLHSWSNKGNWKGCCYTSDHARASCMWDKPSELTDYPGKGYEISYMGYGRDMAADALEGWQSSHGHHRVIINQPPWTTPWNAIGIGIYKNFAVVWFGREEDVSTEE